MCSAVDNGGAGGARAPPEFGGSEKGRSLISAYWSLAITTNTPGFKKLSTALVCTRYKIFFKKYIHIFNIYIFYINIQIDDTFCVICAFIAICTYSTIFTFVITYEMYF